MISTASVGQYFQNYPFNIEDNEMDQTKTMTMAAKTRVNRPTLAHSTPSETVAKVKAKLAKEILEQLIASNLIKVESVVNPKNGSITFTATLEAMVHEDETTKLAA